MTESVRHYSESSKQALSEIADDLKGYLEYMRESGHAGVALSDNSRRILQGWGKEAETETLEMIRENLGECRRCKLHKARKNIVFGAGNAGARLVIVGEGPGSEEDFQGLPFVGKAGQLLTRMLKAINLTREDVYICNIIKCRPPGNRNPAPDEIDACIPFLRRQLKAITPHLICTLGSFAAQNLLETNIPISQLRGRFRIYKGIRLLATYHPAFLLRNPGKKREAWEDMQMLQEAYENAHQIPL